DPQDNVNGGSSLHLRPRDMAKFGFLYLQGGTWDGNQIFPQSWAEASYSTHAILNDQTEYGYQWWIHPPINAYAAQGYLSQYIYVFPDQDMVVVFTARSSDMDIDYLLENFIIPATIISPNWTSWWIGFIIAGTIGPIVLLITAVFLYRRRRLGSS
ncbi:MAG: serine hydrolase, partial [Candidatus Thorarchaeota archaeon]